MAYFAKIDTQGFPVWGDGGAPIRPLSPPMEACPPPIKKIMSPPIKVLVPPCENFLPRFVRIS